jgi:hypothetical protein
MPSFDPKLECHCRASWHLKSMDTKCTSPADIGAPSRVREET